MKPIFRYNVLARVPERLKPLQKIAHNLWFSWHQDVQHLFRRMDEKLWDSSNHNPVYMLGNISQQRLEELARDAGFLTQVDRTSEELERYLSAKPPHEGSEQCCVAYFSAEFGLAECLPLYSGGLGILAGDHLKSASDLNLPLVGVGLFYHKGFFQQYLNADGWQQEAYPENDISTMPLRLVEDGNGRPVTVEVEIKEEIVKIQIWQLLVGRISLYLLDTNLQENSAHHRHITARLYGGDWDMRIRQEIVLGIGGVRALNALGIEASVFHMNEGHSAFSALERIRILRAERGLSFDAAREFVVATNAFTTHTPVPAGNDMFSPELIHTYFSQYVHSLGIAFKVFLGFGRQNPLDEAETFSMTVLALRLSSHANAVSRLHATVARRMWHKVWPKNPIEDIPIYPITNGVHVPSWVSEDMAELFNRYVGPNWIEDPDSGKIWGQTERIPDSELWKTHERRRERLVAFTRERLHCHLTRCGVSARDLRAAKRVLNPEILTVGFARRFAEYKRATLLLLNEERLIKLLTHPERPIQIIIAGKAHPHDNGGKELIRRIIHFANQPEIRHRFVFMQDYNIRVARMMLQGCDIWLNTPRRPLEACGTSGMKAVANGVLNVSTLDGWWDEGYEQRYGWAIGQGETYEDHQLQDEVESRELFDLLEREVVPLFYDRGSDNLPAGWIDKMKAAMTGLTPTFNSHRMVQDYQTQCYESIAQRYSYLARDDMKGATQLAEWRQKIMTNWDQIEIRNIIVHDEVPIAVSTHVQITADVFLGKLEPSDVDVDLYFGPLTFEGEFTEKDTVAMNSLGPGENGGYHYEGKIPCTETGKYGFTIRIMPTRSQMETPYSTGLVIWAKEGAFVKNQG